MKRATILPAAVVAIVVSLAIPTMVHATTLQAEGTSVGKGEEVIQQSSNFFLSSAPFGNFKCEHFEFRNIAGSSGGSDVTTEIQVTTLKNCLAGGVVMHLTYNPPWSLQIQQPGAAGQLTAHLSHESGGSMQFLQQVQVSGVSVLTCAYVAESIQFTGEEGSSKLTISGEKQFVRESGNPELCIENMTVGGSFALTLKSNGKAVTVDMT